MPEIAAPLLPVGSMLAHYRLEEQVGEGAMGIVYRAHDEGLDRTVAVKVLRSGTSGATMRVDRFFQEARAAARVNHPNLTHVHFVGGDGSYRFFAMEYVKGLSLDEYVEQTGPLDLDAALDLLVQAAAGLAAIHDAGIVHRDVKPSNILVRPDGVVKVTDLGLSKSLGGEVTHSHEGAVTGTPTFMSPEQCRGRKVDPRTDIYALGLTAWAMLVRRPPYPGPNLGAVINDQINTPLPPLRIERPDLPRCLERVLEGMCAKKANDRPADMHAVIDQLESCRTLPVHPAPIAARAVSVAIDLAAAGVALAAIGFLMRRVGGAPLPELLDLVLYSLLFVGTTLATEIRHRRTLGKWFLDLEVRAADGSEAPWQAMLGRTLIRFPSLFLWATGLPLLSTLLAENVDFLGLAAVIGGLLTFYVGKGRTLSDLWTRTRVVYRMPPDARGKKPSKTR